MRVLPSYDDGKDYTFIRGHLMPGTLENVLQDTTASLKVLKALTENSFDAILITDAMEGSKIIYANKAFKKLTGYGLNEVLGKTPKILQGAATNRRVIACLSKALKQDDRFEGKAINYKKDGTPFIMHWRVLPVRVGEQTKAWVAIQRNGL
jgi:PAS domain S-box-containing protein